MELDRLALFAAVADAGSFTTAAERLGTTKSRVSREVARLEEDLGLQLLHRTTRRVVPTPAGATLHLRLRPLLAALSRALDLPDREDQPAGCLRVTATADVAAAVLGDVLASYAMLYPQVEIELSVSTRVVDLVAEGFDAAIRVTREALPDTAELNARRIGRVPLELFAAPAYLARAGIPASLADLEHHDLVGVSELPEIGSRLRIRCDDMFATRALVRAGAGVGLVSAYLAAADVAAGDLVRVVPDWVGWTGRVWLVTPHVSRVPARLSAFRDLLLETLARTRALGDS